MCDTVCGGGGVHIATRHSQVEHHVVETGIGYCFMKVDCGRMEEHSLQHSTTTSPSNHYQFLHILKVRKHMKHGHYKRKHARNVISWLSQGATLWDGTDTC